VRYCRFRPLEVVRRVQNQEISYLWVCLTFECTRAYRKCVKASSCLGNDVVDSRRIGRWERP